MDAFDKTMVKVRTVVRRVEVFGGVLVLGRIAAANIPAFETEAQVYPDPTSMWGRWPLDTHS
jgi:hypothetical protein